MAATKTLGEVTTVTTVSSSQFIILTDANGNVSKITLANLATAVASAASAASTTAEP